ALACVLLLRGPQTPGELRGRTERLHRFEEIADVLAGLQKLMEREPSLVVQLPRQPGMKESRWAHLLSGPVEAAATPDAGYARRESLPPAPLDASAEERVARMEATVAALRQEMAALRQKIDDIFGDSPDEER
ncbi:MAG: DUF480 domain-containing protein, partial [Terracidiphilus sp.]